MYKINKNVKNIQNTVVLVIYSVVKKNYVCGNTLVHKNMHLHKRPQSNDQKCNFYKCKKTYE